MIHALATTTCAPSCGIVATAGALAAAAIAWWRGRCENPTAARVRSEFATGGRQSSSEDHVKRCTSGVDRKPKAQQLQKRGSPGQCPGCGASFPDIHKHMRRCCPEQMPRSADEEAVNKMRKEMSPDDWLDEADVRAAAAKAIYALEDPLQRRALELRFGLDRGGVRRSPVEVGQILGGKYAKNGQTAQCLIRTALGRIPLVADDPVDLVILYEDSDMVAVAKPPYLRTTPVHRFCGKSLGSQLLGHLRQSGHDIPPYLVHRLDQSTSGVYLCAKTKAAAASLQEHWHGPMCSKEYFAIVQTVGRMEPLTLGHSFVVDAPIARAEDIADDIRRVIDHGEAGQAARTRFVILAIGAHAAALSCTLLESGRTHQIRVHASHAGLPLIGREDKAALDRDLSLFEASAALVNAFPLELYWRPKLYLSVATKGDGLYGGCHDPETAGINRVALHAWKLRLRHPGTGESVHLAAPLPVDIKRCAAAHNVDITELVAQDEGAKST